MEREQKKKPCVRHPGQFETMEPHSCPYQEEINNDASETCYCCPECEQECAWDI